MTSGTAFVGSGSNAPVAFDNLFTVTICDSMTTSMFDVPTPVSTPYLANTFAIVVPAAPACVYTFVVPGTGFVQSVNPAPAQTPGRSCEYGMAAICTSPLG